MSKADLVLKSNVIFTGLNAVVLLSDDGHCAWLNSKALEESKVTKDTKMECVQNTS